MARTREEHNKYQREYYALHKKKINQQRNGTYKKGLDTYDMYKIDNSHILFVSRNYDLYFIIDVGFTEEEYRKILKILSYRSKYSFNVVNDVLVYNTKINDLYRQIPFKRIKDPYNQLLFIYNEIEKGTSQSEIYEKYYKNKIIKYEPKTK